MNIQEYISSGIVESYVLGLANVEEQVEFEKMCASHGEVRAAREAFESLLERHALTNAIEAPQNIKSKIFAELEMGAIKRKAKKGSGEYSRLEGKRSSRPLVRMNWPKYLAAASIVLLVGSTALNFYFFTQYKRYSNRYEEMLAQNTELARNEQVMRTSLQEYQNAMELLKNPGMAIIKMPGTNVASSPAPNSIATVFWDTTSKDVYLMVNNMPKTASDKQYQLWALVDGQAVDAGVFDVKDGVPLMKMKNIPRAQAFAVTLEKKGGSSTPTMDQMYVMGKVS